jgi:hypothetical protein
MLCVTAQDEPPANEERRNDAARKAGSLSEMGCQEAALDRVQFKVAQGFNSRSTQASGSKLKAKS